MGRQLTYAFEELPLMIADGFSAGLVNGKAILNYWTDGTWGLAELYLDGCRRRPTSHIVQAILEHRPGPVCWEERDIPLDRGTPLHSIIWDRLENEWRGFVQDAVNHAIETEREAAHA